ncbi:hypothetical protein D9753_30170 [Streptomyces dangxiongensis]|uniref:Lipoprotein n=1 Tax=Streptomyces dangxiongensis TaxID=1442032 RepID=A0A3G2JJ39_9ACTN|nr:hypothetical protein [Streptomyces dangxiongensis]AYN42446.1 hypothetical protein D9753_30170 [Streptomyces dangxiongensis]
MKSVLVRTSVAVIAVGSLTACSDGSGGANTSGNGKKPPVHITTSAPSLKLQVPAGYDASRGWQLSGDQLGTYAVLPHAGAIATMTGTGSAYRVTLRDAATGRVRWTGKPFKDLSESETPGLVVVPVGGKDRLVTWSRGETGGDALSKAEQEYAVDIYAADGSGDAVAPTHHVEVPATDYGTGRVTAAGERLLVPVTDKRKIALDVATGGTTTYDTGSLEVPGCSSCSYGNEVAALTEQDPVVLNEGEGAFGIPGSWDDDRIAPAEADPATGMVWPGSDGHLIARWEEKNSGSHNVWAVLDDRTGRVQASVLCAKPSIGSGEAPGSALSPNGRYLVSEHLAFDLRSKKGYCFEETDDRKPLTFTSVTDDGIAYGTSLTKGHSLTGTTAPVQLALAAGSPKALTGVEQTPLADLDGVGVFTHRADNEPYLVVYRHKA